MTDLIVVIVALICGMILSRVFTAFEDEYDATNDDYEAAMRSPSDEYQQRMDDKNE